MLRHGLRLRPRGTGARYRVRRWPRFAPGQYARLLDWFAAHGRQFPWRATGVTPWALLMAEMLLRQTSTQHVARVWPRLVGRYPHPSDLLAAPPEEVQAQVRPLGMPRVRTTALQAAARVLVEQYGGTVPAIYADLVALPHVGPYAANAVLCFGFDIAEPIVDVNILRIFERYFGLSTRTHNPHREPHIWRQATRLMPAQQPAAYQYALLDLAGLVCRSRQPACLECPIRSGCQYFLNREAPQGYTAYSARA